MIDEFNGKLNMEWIPVTEQLPLEEYDTFAAGMIAYVLVLVVDPNDRNEDPAVVSMQYMTSVSSNEEGWYWTDGSLYPEKHTENIRYWTYHPHYKTKDILEYEKIRPIQKFCEGKKPVDNINKL